MYFGVHGCCTLAPEAPITAHTPASLSNNKTLISFRPLMKEYSVGSSSYSRAPGLYPNMERLENTGQTRSRSFPFFFALIFHDTPLRHLQLKRQERDRNGGLAGLDHVKSWPNTKICKTRSHEKIKEKEVILRGRKSFLTSTFLPHAWIRKRSRSLYESANTHIFLPLSLHQG